MPNLIPKFYLGARKRPVSDKPVVPRHAIIGIIAVCLATVNSTLASGMISAGLPDLRGVWGLGIDDATYIPTAFNAAQMFMGPFSIMLAARFGHRLVLLWAGVIYVIAMLLIPLVPPIVPILVLIMVAGLSSGTFYPLCLSFITRNLPLSLVTYGVAAYNLDLLATNHMTQALEGFYMDHATWHWLFWNESLLSLPLLLCVYFGIPPTPKDQLLPKFSYAGLVYISSALTLLYIALDQGERLDWWNNGLINGLFITGGIILVAAFVRRRFAPNPFLDFSYLKSRNILILGVLLVLFRTLILRTATIIPQFLERLHQYRSTEVGALLSLSLIPFMVAMPASAFFLKKIEVRWIMLAGFASLALVNFADTHALSTWIGHDFVWGQMYGAVGICLVGMGVMCGTVFEGRVSGAYRNRAGAYCQGAFFQVVRLFGSESTTSGLRRYLLLREHFWQSKLVSDLSSFNQFDQRLGTLGIALAPQVSGPAQALGTAGALVAARVQAEAFTLAIDDALMLLGFVCIVGLLAVAMMKPTPLPEQLPAADAT